MRSFDSIRFSITALQERQRQNQLDQMRGPAESWTGNQLQVLDLGIYEIPGRRKSGSELIANIDRDGIALTTKPKFNFSPTSSIALK